jgi:predicted small lipoprotein YifL
MPCPARFIGTGQGIAWDLYLYVLGPKGWIMRKLLVILIAAFCFGTLGGCGKGDKGPDAPPADSNPQFPEEQKKKSRLPPKPG